MASYRHWKPQHPVIDDVIGVKYIPIEVEYEGYTCLVSLWMASEADVVRLVFCQRRCH